MYEMWPYRRLLLTGQPPFIAIFAEAVLGMQDAHLNVDKGLIQTCCLRLFL